MSNERPKGQEKEYRNFDPKKHVIVDPIKANKTALQEYTDGYFRQELLLKLLKKIEDAMRPNKL